MKITNYQLQKKNGDAKTGLRFVGCLLFNHLTAIISVLVIFICFSGQISAQVQEKVRVWKNPPEQVVINDHFSFIYQQDVSSEITVIHILVKGGKRAVPVSQRGLSFITTGLAVEMTDMEALRQLTQMATTHYYHIQGDYVTISIRCLTENLEKTLKIIARVLRKPLFSGLRISNVKRYLKHRQQAEEDSPDQLMELTFFNTLFPAYAGSIYGDRESLKKIKKKHIRDFYQRFFNHANMIISVCTDLSKAEIIPIISKNFDSFPPGKPQPLETVPASVPEKKEIFLKKDNQQVLISFGTLLPGMSGKNFALIYLLENLLGKGIGSKLWPLRAKKELAYSLNTRFMQMEAAGLLTISLKTDISKKEEAHQALKDLILDLYKNGITPEDLAITKVRSRADFLRDNETKERRAHWLAYFEALGVGFNYLEAFFSHLDQVTLEELNTYLKKVLNPHQLLEVVIGRESGDEEET
ncbi:MAG: pitrilysin family protein [Candidatus Aminicenantes bacterium]|jgi:predicted Zn-dependent peptidase